MILSGLNHDLSRKKGDMIAYIKGILDKRGRSTDKVVEVKGHATDAMVDNGSVRRQDKQRIELLIWVGEDNFNMYSMPKSESKMLLIFGTPLFVNYINLSLLLLEQL